MIIHVDTNEQQAYHFQRITAAVPFEVRRTNLNTGDYCVNRFGGLITTVSEQTAGFDYAVVERKSLADLYGTVARGRRRFEAELQRMTWYGYRAIVIEAEWSAILTPNAHLAHATNFKPKAMLASLLAWSQRYGVHVFACPGRRAGEVFTFRILERWYRDTLAKGVTECPSKKKSSRPARLCLLPDK